MTTDGGADGYVIRADLDAMDLDRIHGWLSTDAYWALGRSRDNVETAARNSVNVGLFAADGQQVAYARVVTDRANFAWLCDVYVDRDHRGRGLGGRLVDAVLTELEPLGLGRVLLATRDAHDVYARAGFEPLPRPQDWMIRR
ncbi:Acetyltransferase (GNAT) family protein [Nocardioides alpinus]|uniref:Acetyltransferase (GNAT) family protein n=1 Tax=Nocardioides alpinus TaxID=748909 RepID=A0A1I0ZCR9_9ACTN|nr:GNAT family N-acetyltransferase [Nocardioides alpinus]PKH40710.1 N-acetyltransferase [Nocardioides alpinus]SFB22926.1 Acetyltransferase (GNAT) family protein [Nocardioides alpinus]